MWTNPFACDGVWLKANFHTHTTASDGESSPAERVAQYRDAGYDVLAITDHGVVTPVAPLAAEAGGMLLLQGIEMHPACDGGAAYHLVGLNVAEDFAYSAETEANALVQAVREGGGAVIFAHPYWCGHTPEQILAVPGLAALEVYNATCTKIGKGDSSVVWDYYLDAGGSLPAVAVDDVHRGRDRFMGWTMLKARDRTVEAVLAALREGAGYASCGPEFHDLQVEDGILRIACSEVAEIHCIGRRASGRSFYADHGPPLTRAEIPLPHAPGYIRVEIVDARGRKAWTNPFFLPGEA